MTTANPGAIRVLELSDVEESAAYCGKLFARWGAEVVKVERPGRAEPERALDAYLNGGKRRVSLVWDEAAGRDTLDRLSHAFDLVITDAPAREVREHALMTLGGNKTRAVVSISPFGLDGPYADFEATAATLLALGGYTWLMGDPGRAPLTMPGQYPWYQAGTYAYIAALAAALDERRAGEPAHVEVSVLECLASLHQFTDTMWTDQGIVRSRHGNRWENLCPTTLLPCADGWFGLNVLERFWIPFAHMVGHPEFTEDHPYATNAGRMQNEDGVEAAVMAALGTWTRERIFREGQETWRVPIGTALSLQELLDDPHLDARAFWRPLGSSGVRTAGSPFRFVGSEPPAELESVAPGTDTLDVVASLEAGDARPETAPAASRARTRPLEGVRVLDLTRIWSGPLATRILGDLGAEVIKIEAPTNRGAPPPGSTGRWWNRQALFNKLSRNKSSVALDLKAAGARELFLRLVAASDVVVENFSARAMPSLGLGYEALREANGSIIYLTMPAFGRDGPYRDYVGLGPSIEPATGLTALMGYSDAEPRVTAKALTDAMAGTTAVAAVLTGLERRRRTGQGAFIDLSQHEVGVAFLGEHVVERQLADREPARTGNAHPRFAPHGVYRCAGIDSWLALAARDDDEWARLCAFAGAGWEHDVRFASLALRREHRAALDAAIETWTGTRDRDVLMADLQAQHIPAGAVQSPPEWLADRHLLARGYFVDLDHVDAGRARLDGSPLRFDGERGYEDWRAAPGLGEHNEDVLRAVLGATAPELAALERAGMLVTEPPA
jgi:crotonobetainyl-CoA:carnitine CoA-transferase CaiB-like acyl-CoA transferase